MFEIKKIYKNRNCLDIVFLVEKTQKSEEGYTLEGKWLNRHYDLMYICDEEIKIPNHKLNQWVEYKGVK